MQDGSTGAVADVPLRFDVVTLFAELFDGFASTSLIGKAIAARRMRLEFTDPRYFTRDKHRSVDDTPYGGGEGMVLKPGPVVEALEAVVAADPRPVHRVLLSPQGRRLDQRRLADLSQLPRLALVCGRYEGFDERIRDFVDEEISLGDFVLAGGEIAAMALIEGIARLLPGVLGNENSAQRDSYTDGLLEYPQYTRPRDFRGRLVPPVLLSGDHEQIARWRGEQQLCRTKRRRPDLWAKHRGAAQSSESVGTHLAKTVPVSGDSARLASRSYVALLHHPVHDRDGKVVTTALTNLDLHDIARAARTYDLAGYFVVTPLESQRELAQRIVSHWTDRRGAGTEERRNALALVRVHESLADATATVQKVHGQSPVTVATTAATRPGQVPCSALAQHVPAGAPIILLLGTGWGLTDEVINSSQLCLRPVAGAGTYNHLSVRSAAAILLDRLFGMGQ